MVCRAEAGSEERFAAADAEADFLDGLFMIWGRDEDRRLN
jgi:hypothetical protein